MSPPCYDHDVTIVGAGLIGAALGCLLAESPLKVLVIDAKQPKKLPPKGYDLRVSAISLASERILDAIGCWESVRQQASPFRKMFVWDACGSGHIEFDCAEVGTTHLGHILENTVIVDALVQRIGGSANVEVQAPAELLDVVHRADCVELTVQGNDQRKVASRLLVGADGIDSRVRTAIDAEVSGWTYKQRAIVATVGTEMHHGDTAWQRFLPSGPLAFLPLCDGHSSIVWSCDDERADALLQLGDADFMAALGDAFEHRLGEIQSVSNRLSFPLNLMYARSYIGKRTALVGDAAHSFHPLAGQGANLGLVDAACLAELIQDAESTGVDIAARSVLRRYERWRKGDNLAMMLSLDGFKRIFSNDHALVAGARNVGLDLAHYSGPMKRYLMRKATGLVGDLPRVALQR